MKGMAMRGRLTKERIARVLARLFPQPPAVRIDRQMLRASLANCEDEMREMHDLMQRVQSRQTRADDTIRRPRLPTYWH
jgi:hypothetical protein